MSKPIRYSTWTLRHITKKSDIKVAKYVIVTGTEDDISSIKNNFLYLGRAYRDIFGKDKWYKKRKENKYVVIKVELDSKILGYTNV